MVIKKSSNKRTLSKKMARRNWDSLTFRQKDTRLRALETLSLMRKERKSMTVATSEIGISATTFRKHVGRVVAKRDGKWKAKRHDNISRVMAVFSNGRRFNIETRDSKTASIVGRYNSAVGQFTRTGDPSNLIKLKGVVVKDASGRKYFLETRPKKVVAILERLEDPDVPTIYAIAS